MEALDTVKPDVLIGATGAPGTFNEGVIRKMAEINENPVVFALSNPTSRAECTAEQAYKWSDGRVIFSSGSPFSPVVLDDGSVKRPGQGNNAYVFPGIGLGALAANAQTLPDALFLTAAKTLADFVSEDDIAEGALYPRLNEIRTLSQKIAVSVAQHAHDLGIARASMPADLDKAVTEMMYDPRY